MRTTYDKESGCAYVYLCEGDYKGRAVKTHCVSTNIYLDFDAQGRVIGIELIDDGAIHPDVKIAAGGI